MHASNRHAVPVLGQVSRSGGPSLLATGHLRYCMLGSTWSAASSDCAMAAIWQEAAVPRMCCWQAPPAAGVHQTQVPGNWSRCWDWSAQASDEPEQFLQQMRCAQRKLVMQAAR